MNSNHITLQSATLIAVALTLSAPASAANGVRYVHLEPLAVDCSPGNPLPCPFPAGTPKTESNVIYVKQTLDGNGEPHFNTVETNVAGDADAWFGTKYEAQCKSTKRLGAVALMTGYD